MVLYLQAYACIVSWPPAELLVCSSEVAASGTLQFVAPATSQQGDFSSMCGLCWAANNGSPDSWWALLFLHQLIVLCSWSAYACGPTLQIVHHAHDDGDVTLSCNAWCEKQSVIATNSTQESFWGWCIYLGSHHAVVASFRHISVS
jgi:hypothetical protein